jgi:acyl dehydratase
MKSGDILTGVPRTITWDRMVRFESVVWDRGTTAHNDPETAAKGGMTRPFSSGQNTLAFFHELFEKSFGRGWIEGGTIAVRWIRVVYAGDTVVPHAEIERLGEKDGRPLAEMRIWAENQDGETTAAGKATAFLP